MESKTYIITETLEGTPMTLGNYNKIKGWQIPADEDPDAEGYFVTYPNSTTSWRAKDVFEKSCASLQGKSFGNTTASTAKENVSDIVFWGDGDMWKLLGKASSKNEKWMKSSKAMEIRSVGCVIQVTTQQGDNVAEAVVFVPDVRIHEIKDDKGVVVSRKIVHIKL